MAITVQLTLPGLLHINRSIRAFLRGMSTTLRIMSNRPQDDLSLQTILAKLAQLCHLTLLFA